MKYQRLGVGTFSKPQYLGLAMIELDTALSNYIFLLARYYIYTCKLKTSTPTIAEFKSFLLVHQKFEEQVAINKNTVSDFQKKMEKN